MKQYPHTCAQEKCDTSDMRAEVDLKPGTFTSFFVPALPKPGQNDYKKCCPVCNDDVSPYDCCFTSLTLAASCRAQQKGSSYFLSRTNGTMDMKVGDFEIKTVEYSQPSAHSAQVANLLGALMASACTIIGSSTLATFLRVKLHSVMLRIAPLQLWHLST